MKTKLKDEDTSVLSVTLPDPAISLEERFVVLLLFSVLLGSRALFLFPPHLAGASAASDRAAVGHSSGARLNLHLPPLLQLLRGRGASSL